MFYETELEEFSLDDFSRKYTFPTLAMVKGGFHGDSHHSILDTGQVLRIQGLHREQRVLGTVLSDPTNCLGPDGPDMVLSLLVSCDIPMFVLKKGKPAKKTASLQTVLAEHKLPIDVQLDISPAVKCRLRLGDKRLPLSGNIHLKLYQRQNVKYLYGNPVNEGQLHRNIFSIPTHSVDAMLSLVTGLINGNDDYYESIIHSMDCTVSTYIDFEGRVGCRDVSIVPKSEQKQSLEEPVQKYTLSEDKKDTAKITQIYEKTSPATDDDHVYDVIGISGDIGKLHKIPNQSLSKANDKLTVKLATTKETSDRKRSVLPEFIRSRFNHNKTEVNDTSRSELFEPVQNLHTPVVKGPSVQQRSLPNIPGHDIVPQKSKTTGPNKTSVNVQVLQPVSSKTTPEKPIKILRKISSSSDVQTLSVQDLSQYLEVLKLDRHVNKFSESLVDGQLLQDLDENVLQEEFEFTRFEAIKLCKFARTGYLPNVSDYSYL